LKPTTSAYSEFIFELYIGYNCCLVAERFMSYGSTDNGFHRCGFPIGFHLVCPNGTITGRAQKMPEVAIYLFSTLILRVVYGRRGV
jgi:hypothetical protein